jgi:hypothetical protein
MPKKDCLMWNVVFLYIWIKATGLVFIIINVIISVHYYQSHHFSYFVCTIIWNLSLVKQEKPKVVDDDDDDVSTKMAQMVCSLTNREECIACGS